MKYFVPSASGYSLTSVIYFMRFLYSVWQTFEATDLVSRPGTPSAGTWTRFVPKIGP